MMPSPRWDTQKSFGLIPDGLLSVKNSLATSHCQILPLKWVTSSVMCLCSRAQLAVADGAVGDAGGQPVGQLVVPDQRVSADELVVLLGEGDQAVAAGPVVGAAGGLDDLPLHLVAGGHRGELVAGDLRVGGVVEVERRDGGADPQADRRGQRAQRVGRRPEPPAAGGGARERRGAAREHGCRDRGPNCEWTECQGLPPQYGSSVGSTARTLTMEPASRYRYR